MDLHERLSKAYWPRQKLNESADRERGNAEVDKLTLGELAEFFSQWQFGPTYCLVADRVQEQLKKFPPHIEDKRRRAVDALYQAKNALIALQQATDGL